MKTKPNLFIHIIWKEGEYFVAQCLNIDVSSFGETQEEALENLKEAIALRVEDEPRISFSEVSQPSIHVLQA